MIFASRFPLDAQNGAGMSAVLPYIRRWNPAQIHSVYWDASRGVPSTSDIVYHLVPVSRSRWRYAQLLAAGWRWGRRAGREGWPVVVLPDTPEDCALGRGMAAAGGRVLGWFMDDFAAGQGRVEKMVRAFYRAATQRAVVSQALGEALQTRYGKSFDVVLGRAALSVRESEPRDFSPEQALRLVHLGSTNAAYSQILPVLADVASQYDLQIDFYGPRAPELSSPHFHYRGFAPADDLGERLASYDGALLSYSFDAQSARWLRRSSPSKLVDYLAATLPVLAFLPADFAISGELRVRDVGVLCHDPQAEAVTRALQEFREGLTSAARQRDWANEAARWVREEFAMDLLFPRFERALENRA